MLLLERDILTVQAGTIVHQGNTLGKMGAGLAKQIRVRWPRVYVDYEHALHEGAGLGDVVTTVIGPGLFVATILAQATIGRYGQHTDYDALRKGLAYIDANATRPIHIPFMMGCGLGGADWGTVLSIIEQTVKSPVICRIGRNGNGNTSTN